MDRNTFYEELKRKEKRNIEIIVLIALACCLVLVVFLILNNKSKALETEQVFIIGEYECSEEVYYEGEMLKPSKIKIDAIDKALDESRLEVDLLALKIQNGEKMDDEYNLALEDYNSNKAVYLDLEQDYNQKVVEYNNYIKQNCDKQ